MRAEERERRAAALDLRFEVGVAAHALAVANAWLVDAKQNERRLGGKPRQELIDPRRRPLRTLDRVAAQPGNEQDRRTAARRSSRPRQDRPLPGTLRIPDRRVDDF